MNDENFSYLSLTPEVQLDALASIGIYPESGLTALNSYENRVFLFTDENKVRYVVKFYRPQRWQKEQLQEEHNFCSELRNQGCQLSPPIEIKNQSLFFFPRISFCIISKFIYS